MVLFCFVVEHAVSGEYVYAIHSLAMSCPCSVVRDSVHLWTVLSHNGATGGGL